MKKNMFVQQTLERYMIPHTQHFEDGRKVEKLDVKELRWKKTLLYWRHPKIFQWRKRIRRRGKEASLLCKSQ